MSRSTSNILVIQVCSLVDYDIFISLCIAEYGYVSVYSDSACSNLLLSQNFAIGCAFENNYYYYGSEVFSFSIQCTSSSTIPLDSSTSYVLDSEYDSLTGCSSSTQSGFFAYKNQYCISRPNGDYSVKFSYPSFYQYTSSSSCSGSKYTSTLATTCQVDAADDYYNYYYGYGHIQRSYVYSLVGTTSSPSRMRK